MTTPTVPETPGAFDSMLREILSREQLYAEDFYELVERMPSALSVGAEAMELTVAEFRRRLSEGLLSPYVVLSRMADAHA